MHRDCTIALVLRVLIGMLVSGGGGCSWLCLSASSWDLEWAVSQAVEVDPDNKALSLAWPSEAELHSARRYWAVACFLLKMDKRDTNTFLWPIEDKYSKNVWLLQLVICEVIHVNKEFENKFGYISLLNTFTHLGQKGMKNMTLNAVGRSVIAEALKCSIIFKQPLLENAKGI